MSQKSKVKSHYSVPCCEYCPGEIGNTLHTYVERVRYESSDERLVISRKYSFKETKKISYDKFVPRWNHLEAVKTWVKKSRFHLITSFVRENWKHPVHAHVHTHRYTERIRYESSVHERLMKTCRWSVFPESLGCHVWVSLTTHRHGVQSFRKLNYRLSPRIWYRSRRSARAARFRHVRRVCVLLFPFFSYLLLQVALSLPDADVADAQPSRVLTYRRDI